MATQTSGTSNVLYGVAFASDGRHGWAVGRNGTILATTDGGAQWATQTSGTSNALGGVAFASDGRHGWAVGRNGTILATTDGGAQWATQTSGTSNDLGGVAFASDGRHGWAVGDNGTILATTDGGAQWATQTSGTSNALGGVAFASDGRHGWAVGRNGTILATTDGGAQWATQTSGTSNDLGGVAFASDGRHGWAVGDNGTILATTDGGAQWATQTSGTFNDLDGVAVASDGRHGWAVGGNGTIVISVRAPALETPRGGSASNGLGEMITGSFSLQTDSRLPVWAAAVEARSRGRNWERVSFATEVTAAGDQTQWDFKWKPVNYDFRPGEAIEQRLVVYAGARAPIEKSIGTIVFEPWWSLLWRHNREEIIEGGAVAGILLVYAGGLLGVFVFAPVRLAGAGSAGWSDVPALAGNWAFVLGLLRKIWGCALLPPLCRSRRVRRAWVREYEAGHRKLGDLGRFTRDRFVNEPEVLDAWVAARVPRMRDALEALDLYKQRRIYVPLALQIGSRQLVDRPDPTILAPTFELPRAVVCIIGSGGAGKSTLACAIARWAMADDRAERLAPHWMLPVFVFGDTTDLETSTTKALREALGDEELPSDLIRGLLQVSGCW